MTLAVDGNPAASIPRTDVLGLGVSAVDPAMTVRTIGQWIAGGARQYVCVTGVHGVMESQQDAELLEIHARAGLVVPDGMPLVWLSHLAGRAQVRRVYGPDLMLNACAQSVAHGWRHYFFGGMPGVAEHLASVLSARFPGLVVAGTGCPPFASRSDEEFAAELATIEATRPDIVWVGMSTPKQERWMARARPHLSAPVLLAVGAAFDFNAGLKRQAPRWMQGAGLEWLFRLATEPRRLGRRYLVNNSRFVWSLARQSLRSRATPPLLASPDVDP